MKLGRPVTILTGSSYPENSLEFFKPIVQWVKDFLALTKDDVRINIRLNYLNTSSTKCLLDIFEMLDGFHKAGGSIKMFWYYAKDDEDIMDTGEELCEDFDFPITFEIYEPGKKSSTGLK